MRELRLSAKERKRLKLLGRVKEGVFKLAGGRRAAVQDRQGGPSLEEGGTSKEL